MLSIQISWFLINLGLKILLWPQSMRELGGLLLHLPLIFSFQIERELNSKVSLRELGLTPKEWGGHPQI